MKKGFKCKGDLFDLQSWQENQTSEELCTIYEIYSNSTKRCNPSYSVIEDTGTYGIGWIQQDESAYSRTSPWVHTVVNTSGIRIHSYTGNFYDGGGYIAYLGQTFEKVTGAIASLVYSGWLNRWTEFIEIKAILYNVNTNLMSVLLILTENVPPLGFKSRIKVVSFKYDVSVSYVNYIYFIFLGVFVTKTIIKICQQGTDYIQSCWSLTDPAFAVLCIATSVVYIVNNWKFATYIEEIERGGKDEYYSTTLLTNLHFRLAMQCIVVLNVVFCILCIIRALRLGRRLLNFYYTLKLAQNDLICVLILLFFLLYGQVNCVWYAMNSHPKQHLKLSSFLVSSRSGHQIIIYDDDHINKHIVFITYTYFCVAGAYLFCAIIGHSYGVAKHYNLRKSYTSFSHILNIHQICANLKSWCTKGSKRIWSGISTSNAFFWKTSHENK